MFPPIQAQSNITDKEKRLVLTKALLNLSMQLDISRSVLSKIVGISEATLSRKFALQNDLINPKSNDGQLVILLLRLFRSLDALFGGNSAQCKAWLNAYNKHLNNTPIELIQTIEGLVFVVQYLDAIRGKN